MMDVVYVCGVWMLSGMVCVMMLVCVFEGVVLMWEEW